MEIAAPIQATPASERRSGRDRRQATLGSLLRGGLYRNRRRGVRRAADAGGTYVDWYEPRLLYVALGVLVLSCADAALTLLLLELGAVEANVLMARLIELDVALFAAVKIGLTGIGLVVLVAHFSFRLFRYLRVRSLLTACLVGYVILLTHEVAMLANLLPLGPLPG